MTNKWRLPIRIAGGVPVIAVFGDGPVWHDTTPQTPDEEKWLKHHDKIVSELEIDKIKTMPEDATDG